MSDRDGTGEGFKVRREQEETELDITPMIDITFLLLAFFVVASNAVPSSVTSLEKLYSL